MPGSAMRSMLDRGAAGAHRGLPAASVAAFPQRQAVGSGRGVSRRRRACLERVGQQLVGVLLGDPGRRAEASRAAREAGVVVEAHDDDRHVGVAGRQSAGGEQPVVDDDHVGRGPALLARQLLAAAGLRYEDDLRQRAQQSGNGTS